MKNRNINIILNILSLIFALVVNFLATNLPLNNITTGQISDQFDVFFVPSGYVFSIWGLIYISLLAFAVYQALPAQRNNELLQSTDPWFILSNLANALWLVSYHYQQFVLSLIIMAILLVSLIIIFIKLEIGKRMSQKSWAWLVEIPFSIYLGWITVATIANATQVLDFLNWNGFGLAPEIWFIIMIAAAVFISTLMSFTRRNIAFALVLVWALAGIALKFPTDPLINYTAWAGAIAILTIAILAKFTKSKVAQ